MTMALRARYARAGTGRATALMGRGSDPLGEGNTQLIADLGVTPLGLWDVRKNLTLDGSGNASSLVDVVNGIDAAQATSTKRPAWDGTTLKFDGVDDVLLTSALASLDLSQPITVALVAAITNASGRRAVVLAPSAGSASADLLNTGAGTMRASLAGSDGVVKFADGGVSNTPTTMRLILGCFNQTSVSCEVPNHAKVTTTGVVQPVSASSVLSIGAAAAGTAAQPMAFRALIALPGAYTTGQRDTLRTWAQTYHGAVVA